MDELTFSEEVKGKWGEWIEEDFCSKDVERFLLAIREENIDEYIKNKIIPPTFFTCFRKGRPDHGVKGFRTFLHAEQEYEFFSFPDYGERIRYRTRVADIYEKVSKRTGRKMVFVVFETEYYSVRDGRLLCIAKATLVFM
ncbi:hypothetical protein HRbin19_01122 [bacterium HR19]|nr:hypothetical protein HRbin19_01122 [bacterium HR19]